MIASYSISRESGAIDLIKFIDDTLERREGHDSITCFLDVAYLKNEQITSEYLDLRRHQRFLLGCSPSFLILGVGFFFAIRWMGEFDLFGWIAGAGCIGLAVGFPVLARRLSQAAYQIGEWAKTQSSSKLA